MEESGRKSAPAATDEYRLTLPAQIDPRQLLLALGCSIDATPRADVPTLAVFAPRFLSQYARANRQKPRGISSKVSHLEQHLLPLFGQLRLDDFGHEQIQNLKTHLGARAAKTVNNVLSTLSMILKIAVEWGVLSSMPVRITPLKTLDPVPRFYEREQYAQLVNGATNAGARELVAILLGGDCGLRMGEIIALEWPDVDLQRELIHVARAESKGEVTAPKGNKTRFVPMTVELAAALRRVPNGKTARVLHNDKGESLSEQNLRTWLCRAQRNADLEVRGALHILRHTYCSHLAMAGESLLVIKELAGHVSERTTMRYMHLAPSAKGHAIAALATYRSQRY